MELLMRGKREMKPLLVKLGVALALSIAGFLVSRLRSRHRSSLNPSNSGKNPEAGCKPSAPFGGLKDELRILKSEEALAKIINGTSTTTTTTTTTTTFVGLSPTSRSSGDEEGFLLPEFSDLVMKEFESFGRDTETTPSTPTPRKPETKESSTLMEQEIAHLRNLVWSLRERERNLEHELLEYYGMQEQEAALRELESQLKINNVEAKLSSLKIESLQAENRRLQHQLSEHSRTMNELEDARTKIKLLKRKIKLDGEQVKEKIAALLQRISVLQDREQKHGSDCLEAEKLKRLKDFEEEVMNLMVANSKLGEENSELMRKLDAAQTMCSSLRDGPQVKALEEEAERLREANEKLVKEIEQLRIDRCCDVEELVYLKWVNACLRYELRNYQPPPGKTLARDLSRSLSLKSEEKAKQLILEYANSTGDDKGINLMDFDSEDFSSSHTSMGESEDVSTITTPNISTTRNSSNSSKSKFFSKLKKLVQGKDKSSNRAPSADRTPPSYSSSNRRASISTCSFDDVIGRDLLGSFSSSCVTEEQCKSKDGRSRSSLDVQRLRFKGDVEREESSMADDGDTELPEKAELKKFAQVLNSSRPRLERRSSSFSN